MARPATIEDYRRLYAGDYMTHKPWRRYSDCLDLIKARMPATILEVGCGRGDFVREMTRSRCPYVAGIDPAMDDPMPEVGDGHCLRRCDLLAPLVWGWSFGYVCSFDVLEHIPEGDISQAIGIMTKVSNIGQWHAIHTGPDVHEIDGEQVELHVTQRPPKWWAEQFERCNRFVQIREAKFAPAVRFVLEVRK